MLDFISRITTDAPAKHRLIDLEGFHSYKIVYIELFNREKALIKLSLIHKMCIRDSSNISG